MGKSSTPSFVLTLSLRYECWQRDYLDKMFRIAGYIYNNLVSDRKNALNQLERTVQWRTIKSLLAEIYNTIGSGTPTTAQKVELEQLYIKRQAMLKKYGFSEYAFQARARKYRCHYKRLIGSNVSEKIATSVWEKFESYLFGDGRSICFKPWNEFLSIEGKSNLANIRYKDSVVYINKMPISVYCEQTSYEQEALKNRIKYCRIIRRPWPNGWLYSLQLVLEGYPPVKANAETGEIKHNFGKGRVGLDIGTQTLAIASMNRVSLLELADKANLPDKELRRINRAMDRSRRATNTKLFNEDGTIIPRDKLLSNLLGKNGKRVWNKSHRYERLEWKRRYLYAKLARIRKTQHQQLANELLSCGNTFYVEKMDFRSLAKKAKPKDPEPGKRQLRRKRFGKSVANKAPAMFLNILEQKVVANGGQFYRINTWKAKASQYNHLNQQYNKKKLSQRWNYLPDGNKVQRDLYSAFLIMNTNKTLDGFIQDLCNDSFEPFMALHDKEIERLRYIHTPSSTGIRCAV